MCCVGNKGKSNIFPSNLLQAIIITLLRSVCVWPVYTVCVHACVLDQITRRISQQCHSYVAVIEERGAMQSADLMNAAPTDILIRDPIFYPLKSLQPLFFSVFAHLDLRKWSKYLLYFLSSLPIPSPVSPPTFISASSHSFSSSSICSLVRNPDAIGKGGLFWGGMLFSPAVCSLGVFCC